MTIDELTEHFSSYMEQIPRLCNADAYWALLHYVVIFPDICGALESKDGRATGKRYREWVRLYVHEPLLTPADWYEIRCILLHQGRTVGKKHYALYRFGQPGTVSHGHMDPQNRAIDLNVSQLADQIVAAVKKWFKKIAAKPNASKSLNVQKNIKFLAERKIVLGTSASPLQTTQLVSITTHSR